MIIHKKIVLCFLIFLALSVSACNDRDGKYEMYSLRGMVQLEDEMDDDDGSLCFSQDAIASEESGEESDNELSNAFSMSCSTRTDSSSSRTRPMSARSSTPYMSPRINYSVVSGAHARASFCFNSIAEGDSSSRSSSICSNNFNEKHSESLMIVASNEDCIHDDKEEHQHNSSLGKHSRCDKDDEVLLYKKQRASQLVKRRRVKASSK